MFSFGSKAVGDDVVVLVSFFYNLAGLELLTLMECCRLCTVIELGAKLFLYLLLHYGALLLKTTTFFFHFSILQDSLYVAFVGILQ